MSDPSSPLFPIARSNLYLRWMEEKMHIERNKWFLSQSAGFDVGWPHARWDWAMRHREAWLRARESGVEYRG